MHNMEESYQTDTENYGSQQHVDKDYDSKHATVLQTAILDLVRRSMLKTAFFSISFSWEW